MNLVEIRAFGRARDVAALERATEHPDVRASVELRAAVARAFGEARATPGSRRCLAELARDGNRDVRIEAIRSLGTIGDETTVDLLAAIAGDGDKVERAWAAEARHC